MNTLLSGFLDAIVEDYCAGRRMTPAQIMQKMIAYSEGNIHDIDHLIRVWTYAKTIGELEQLDAATQLILEAAAITTRFQTLTEQITRFWWRQIILPTQRKTDTAAGI